MKRIIVSLVTITMIFMMSISSYAAPKDHNENCNISKNLKDYLNYLSENRNFHGSVLVEKNNKVLLSSGFGMADYENKIENDQNTIFPIGSITKQFVAAAILQLADRNKLSIDDPLSKYYPDFPSGDKIKLKFLLNHTSGIVSVFGSDQEFNTKILALQGSELTQENIINLIKAEPLKTEPGTTFSYNNSGFIILGAIIEKVSHKSFEKYLTENIFRPLGMKNTYINYKNDKKMYTCKPYSGFLEYVLVPPETESIMKLAFGAGNLSSTTLDLRQWINSLTTNKILKKESLKQMLSKQVEMDSENSYGYGIIIAQGTNGKEIWHNGAVPGFNGIVSKFVDKNTNIIILTNKDNSAQNLTNVKNDLFKIANGEKVVKPEIIKEIQLSNEQLNKLIGIYDSTEYPGYAFTIKNDNGVLKAQLTGQDFASIYPLSETSFFYKDIEAYINFEKDENNNIISLTLSQYGTDYKFKKSS